MNGEWTKQIFRFSKLTIHNFYIRYFAGFVINIILQQFVPIYEGE